MTPLTINREALAAAVRPAEASEDDRLCLHTEKAVHAVFAPPAPRGEYRVDEEVRVELMVSESDGRRGPYVRLGLHVQGPTSEDDLFSFAQFDAFLEYLPVVVARARAAGILPPAGGAR